MDLVSLNGSTIGPDTRELDIFTQVIPALPAEEAFLTRCLGLDADTVPYSIYQYPIDF